MHFQSLERLKLFVQIGDDNNILIINVFEFT